MGPSGGVDLQCRHFLVKMYAKMKEFGPVGGGHTLARPLDLPMLNLKLRWPHGRITLFTCHNIFISVA